MLNLLTKSVKLFTLIHLSVVSCVLVLIFSYFPRRPSILSIYLYSDQRAQLVLVAVSSDLICHLGLNEVDVSKIEPFELVFKNQVYSESLCCSWKFGVKLLPLALLKPTRVRDNLSAN